MRCADPLGPEDRVDADRAGDSHTNDEVFGQGGVQGQEEDVTDEGDDFDFLRVSYQRRSGEPDLKENLLAMAASQGETNLRWISHPMATRHVQPKAYVG